MTGAAQDSARSRHWRRSIVFPHGGAYEEGAGALSLLLEEQDAFVATVKGLDRACADDLRLVCDELVANVLRHASKAGDATVEVEMRVDARAVRLSVRDNGPAFDSFNQPEPYVGPDVEKRRVGGLGLYLVKKLFPQARQVREGGWNVAEVECPLKREMRGKTRGG